MSIKYIQSESWQRCYIIYNMTSAKWPATYKVDLPTSDGGAVQVFLEKSQIPLYIWPHVIYNVPGTNY